MSDFTLDFLSINETYLYFEILSEHDRNFQRL